MGERIGLVLNPTMRPLLYGYGGTLIFNQTLYWFKIKLQFFFGKNFKGSENIPKYNFTDRKF